MFNRFGADGQFKSAADGLEPSAQKMRERPKIIRLLAAIFLLVLPQALIWLHKTEHHVAATILAITSTLILSFALLKVLGTIFVLSPEGFAICMKRMNRKSFLIFVMGAFHIVYALYQVGWTITAIVLLVFMGITEVLSLIGRARLAKLDEESQTRLWISTQQQIRQAEQDAGDQAPAAVE